MSRPTKTPLSAIKKVACYLQGAADMVLRYERSGEFATEFSRWKHLDDVGVKASHKPHVNMLELFSDSDWATSKSSRRSTSSGLWELHSFPQQRPNVDSVVVDGWRSVCNWTSSRRDHVEARSTVLAWLPPR